MCNIRYQLMAGVLARRLPPQEIMGQFMAQQLLFVSPSRVQIERRKRWVNRFKKLPRRNGPMGRR